MLVLGGSAVGTMSEKDPGHYCISGNDKKSMYNKVIDPFEPRLLITTDRFAILSMIGLVEGMDRMKKGYWI